MKNILALALIPVLLTGCFLTESLRPPRAHKIAAKNHLHHVEIPAGDFVFTVFAKANNAETPASIYIEGDDVHTGIAPTPGNPIALKMAAVDPSENVIYIGRPCHYPQRDSQFTPDYDRNPGCPLPYSTTKRFSPEIISSYSKAIDIIKRKYDLGPLHLYGHSGGAAIAAFLTVQRHDIIDLTTIAGNLDLDLYNENMSEITHYRSTFKPINASLNPANIAQALRTVPQIHYIASNDKVIPPEILNSFLSQMGPTACAQAIMIDGTQYTEGWPESWKELGLVHQKPICKGEPKLVTVKNIQ
jgi:hypothetical protein